MNSYTERKSAQNFITETQQKLTVAEKVHPCVAVTEQNWMAMISTQKAQIELLQNIQKTLPTLTTEKDMKAYMADYRASSNREKISFSRANLENLYAYLRKNRFLLPVAYVHHAYFILTRGFKKLTKKKKTLPKPMHENAQKRQMLFEKLELKKR